MCLGLPLSGQKFPSFDPQDRLYPSNFALSDSVLGMHLRGPDADCQVVREMSYPHIPLEEHWQFSE